MINDKLKTSSIIQYKIEERSFMAKRMIMYPNRIDSLLNCMKNDVISYPENIKTLKKQVEDYTNDPKFSECENMGDILESILAFVKRNYLNISNKELF